MPDPLDDLFWRDEILQIMYWLRGEGLGEAVGPADLVAFLHIGEADIRQQLERLVEEGYARHIGSAPALYELTEFGVKEGGRCFADAFAGLTKQAHGACNNPNCACHTLGPEACESGVAHQH